MICSRCLCHVVAFGRRSCSRCLFKRAVYMKARRVAVAVATPVAKPLPLAGARAMHETQRRPEPEPTQDHAQTRPDLAAKAMGLIGRVASAIRGKAARASGAPGEKILEQLGTTPPAEFDGRGDVRRAWFDILLGCGVHAQRCWEARRWELAGLLARAGVKFREWWSHMVRVCRDPNVLRPSAVLARWVVPQLARATR